MPGEITSSLSAGTNDLLKLGASPLTTAADVLASFGLEPEPAPQARRRRCSSSCPRAPTSSRGGRASPPARSRVRSSSSSSRGTCRDDGVYRPWYGVASRFVGSVLARGAESASAEMRLDGHVDVAIVGGGVTGCSAALRLAEAGLRVRVHDARGIAEGASGRNGGFALRGGAARYDVARETYGAERPAAYWRWTEEALDRIAELAGDALRRAGSYRLAGDEEERDGIRLEYEALREDGFEAEWLDDVPGAAAGLFHGAISHPRRRIAPAGPVRPPPRGARPRRPARSSASTTESQDVEALDADRVLVATDGYGHGLVAELADLIWPTRGQVIVSEPLDASSTTGPTMRARASTTGSSFPTAGSCSAASATSRSSPS